MILNLFFDNNSFIEAVQGNISIGKERVSIFSFHLVSDMSQKLPLILLLIFALISCEKTNFGTVLSINHIDTFEYMWQRINDHYCCFDASEIDWNDVYAEYTPQVNNDMSEISFIQLIDEMLSLLKDHSLSVMTPLGAIRYTEFEQYPSNVDTNTIAFYNPLNHQYLVYDSIAYVNNFNGFSTTLQEIKDRNTKGLILDFRDLVDVNLRGALPTKDIIDTIREEYKEVGIKRKKMGSAPNDFKEKIITYGDRLIGVEYEAPVIILTNYQIFGTVNKLVHIMSEVSNTTLVGTATGSANFGVATSFLPNGWLLNIPEAAIFDLQGNNIGFGVQPDIIEEDDTTTVQIDEVIERALEELR